MAAHMELGWLYDLWQIPNTKAAVVTFGLTVLSEILRRIIIPKGRLAWGISHNEHFILPPVPPAPPPERSVQQPAPPEQLPLPLPPAPPPSSINVRIRQIFIQNVGRAVAEDIEVTINFLPQHCHVFPPIVKVMPNDQDRFLRLQAKLLNKREYFIISMLESRNNTVLPDVVTVRWNGGVAKQVTITPQQQWPTWILRILVLAMYCGFISAGYLLIRLALWIL